MTIKLQAGDLCLTLDPDTGAAIAAFSYRGAELLRPVADPRLAAQHGRAVAGYPLIPYANRIADGRFTFAGQSWQLARNFGDSPHTIHGNGWMRAWSVAEASARHARLTLEHAPPHDPAEQWPFAYHAEMLFTLHDDHLDVALSVQNRDTRPWPAGLGLHPYVARTPETTLRFDADTVWTTGFTGLPASRVAVEGPAEFAGGRLLGCAEIDACYAGWDGRATVAMPEQGMTLVLSSGPPMDHLQVYTPAGRDFLGLEPVSNMPDAINRMEADADQGLRVLAPGESLRASVTLGLHTDAD